ncbi:hypothetical protein EPN96_06700 [bacterium]|nr:MAG: hypothetical protein EPN96_06700 [bacterium]
MDTVESAKLDKLLLKAGVGREGNAAVDALCSLMKSRAGEITQKMLVETDPMNLARMQGAARELLRWADYPAELAEKMKWLKVEDQES